MMRARERHLARSEGICPGRQRSQHYLRISRLRAGGDWPGRGTEGKTGRARHARGRGGPGRAHPPSFVVVSRYPQLRVILSKLTVTTPLALSAKCCTSCAVMDEPSEPASMIVRVKLLLAFFSFMLKFPHSVRWPV
jgi:hypothetical protein